MLDDTNEETAGGEDCEDADFEYDDDVIDDDDDETEASCSHTQPGMSVVCPVSCFHV